MNQKNQEKKDPEESVRHLSKVIPTHFLGRKSWRFWFVILTSMSTLSAALFTREGVLTIPLRWFLGVLFLTFVPGFSLIQALFPKEKELDSVEQLALSIGLSMAIVPFTAFMLSFTPWKIKLIPLLTSLCGLSLICISIGTLRRISLARKKHDNIKKHNR